MRKFVSRCCYSNEERAATKAVSTELTSSHMVKYNMISTLSLFPMSTDFMAIPEKGGVTLRDQRSLLEIRSQLLFGGVH